MHSRSRNIKLHTKLIAVSAFGGEDEQREEFSIFDRDGSGYVSEIELRNALWNLDANPSEAEIIRMINEADVDGDGTISKEDLIKLVGKVNGHITEEVQDAICAYDKNKDTFVSVGEIKRSTKDSLEKEPVNDCREYGVGQQKPNIIQNDINENKDGRNGYESYVTIIKLPWI